MCPYSFLRYLVGFKGLGLIGLGFRASDLDPESLGGKDRFDIRMGRAQHTDCG